MNFLAIVISVTAPLVVVLLPTMVVAQDSDSIRELCRKQVAGSYLTTYNQWVRNRDYEQLLTNQLTTLKAAVVKAKNDYVQKQKDVENHEYDVSIQRAYSAAKDHWEGIKVQIGETTALLKKVNVEHQMAKKEVVKLEAAMKPVFTIVDTVALTGEFPYSVTFKSPCPKYRHTCPLPNKDAYALRKIPSAGEHCEQYASFSLGMNRR